MTKKQAILKLSVKLTDKFPTMTLEEKMALSEFILDSCTEFGMLPPESEEIYTDFQGLECGVLVQKGWE